MQWPPSRLATAIWACNVAYLSGWRCQNGCSSLAPPPCHPKNPFPYPQDQTPPPPPTYPLSYVKVSAHKIFKWFCRKFSSAGVREPSAWLLFKMFRLFKRHAESASCPPRGRGRSRIYLYIYIYIYLKICIYCGDTHMAGTLIRSGWQSKLWYSFPV